jgi:hypothetical protein
VSNNYCYLCVIRLNVIILRIFGEEMLSVVLAVVLPSLVMLSLVILRAIMLSVVMLSVIAPQAKQKSLSTHGIAVVPSTNKLNVIRLSVVAPTKPLR